MNKAIIIGAGVGGLATSIRLATRGLDVTVFEASEGPGGKLSQFQLGDYRFDFGPSLFTLPRLVDDLFTSAGRDPRDHFTYERLPLICRYQYNDGTVLHAHSDPVEFASEVEEKLDVPSEVTLGHLQYSEEINKYTTPVFLEKSLHKLETYLTGSTLRALPKLPGFNLGSTMHQVNERRLGHPKLVQLFDRFATYNGSDPYQAPGILNVIPSLEHLDGSYFPHGGMYAITSALYDLARDLGVKFFFDRRVDRIEIEKGRATGVVVDHKTIGADLVVSNMDVYFTYTRLMPELPSPRRILNQERSSSALVFYWGIDREFPELDVHNIFFSEDYKAEFDHIFNQGDISDDPTIYVNITSKKCASDAPAGGENWFVMINAPHNSGQDWAELISRTRGNVIRKLTRLLGVPIEDHIAEESVTDPLLIERKTSSYCGALYGSSSNDMMAAFMRHPNFSRKIRNLYFCGGSVHPGGGIPLCLLSAKIVNDLID